MKDSPQHSPERAKRLFLTALLTSIIFAGTSWVWMHGINLFVGFPAGIWSLTIWMNNYHKESERKRYQLIAGILVLGSMVSLISLAFSNFTES